ncbi:unnamed protein product [Peniophora sp. CBMAI 1063]|nr:unnamed protein product [Peniophora sp. CBMAI 1063]
MPSSPPMALSPPSPTSPVSPTPSSSSSATATPSGGSTPTLSSLLSAATHVVSAHSQSNLDVPSAASPSYSGNTNPHSRAHSLLRRSRSHNDHNHLLAPPSPDGAHHRRFSLHRNHSHSHSRARSRSRHDAAQHAHADFIAECEARIRERYPDASEEEVRRRVDEEVVGGLEEAEDVAREIVDEDDREEEERRRREKWAAVRAF